jgi:hypothetical protein
MSGKSLLDIFSTHDGYISDKWEQYLGVYESELRAIVETDKPLRLLEIGVQNGGSLQIWSKYLPTGSSIVGIDVDKKCATLDFDSSVQIFIGDATQKSFLDAALGDASFDIIVDDGSHRSADIIASFNALLPRLNLGGKYFIEDLHASYWQSHGGGYRVPDSAIEYLKSLIEPLHFDHLETGVNLGLHDGEIYRTMNRNVARISFYDSIAVIEKYRRPKEGNFRRVFSGKSFEVSGLTELKPVVVSMPENMFFFGKSSEDLFGELAADYARSQGDVFRLQTELSQRTAELAQRSAEYQAIVERLQNELAQRTAQYQATVERLQNELAQRTAEYQAIVEGLQNELAQRTAELAQRTAELAQRTAEYQSIVASLSWRATTPIRNLMDRFPWFTRQVRRALKLG